MKHKKRGILKMIGYVLLAIAVIIVAAGLISWPKLQREHKEAKNLPIADINFGKLKDGTYIGEYEGGMYKWRTNKVQVTVKAGKVTDIQILDSKEAKSGNKDYVTLYGRIIEAQSLQVDTVSGATLTSKAYMKAVENALLKAQMK